MITLAEASLLFSAAMADFKRSKVKTALTSLGITIGVLSVVILIALGLGLKNYIAQQFESLGANLILVFPGSGFSSQGGFGAGLIGGAKFDEKDVNSLKRIPEVDLISPLFMKNSLIKSESKEYLGYLIGTNEQAFKLMNVKMVAGKEFGKSDVSAASKVTVLGLGLAENLFDDPKGAIGKTVRVENLRFKVVGVAEKTGDREMDNSMRIPYKSTYGSINPDRTFFAIYLGVIKKDSVETVKKKVEEVLLKTYSKDDFSVSEQSEILGTVNQIFGVVNIILVAIGSISLIVGGIGIMNIMYATVTERTKEVGIRRAVGATERDILIQFLSEAVILSLFGGIFGLILASLIVLVIRIFFPASINLLSVIVTLLISSGIGIFFGVFPARRAAKLTPIEAIRYE